MEHRSQRKRRKRRKRGADLARACIQRQQRRQRVVVRPSLIGRRGLHRTTVKQIQCMSFRSPARQLDVMRRLLFAHGCELDRRRLDRCLALRMELWVRGRGSCESCGALYGGTKARARIVHPTSCVQASSNAAASGRAGQLEARVCFLRSAEAKASGRFSVGRRNECTTILVIVAGSSCNRRACQRATRAVARASVVARGPRVVLRRLTCAADAR